jgi:hypothetical protein
MFNISNKSNPHWVLWLINIGNREYISCPRSHVVVNFHSSYTFLKNNLVYTMLNPLRIKRVRIYIMPNSLLRKTNSLRSIYHTLMLATIKYSSCNLSTGILFYYISMINGGNQSPASYLYLIKNHFFVLLFFHCKINFNQNLSIMWDESCTCTLCYDIDLTLANKTAVICLLI